MPEIPVNTSLNNTMGTPVYNYGTAPQTLHTTQGQSVSVTPQYSSQIYSYPTNSLYEPKQAASGVNIIICNPAGYSNGQTGCVPYYPVIPQMPQVINNIPQQPAPVINNNIPESSPVASAPIASTEISSNGDNKPVKTKKITKITDDYIRNLETYLRDSSKETRQAGINQLVKLYEEDDPSRYDDPALTALLNIALQDPDASNRISAMLPLSTGSAHGDENTKLLLEKLASSNKMFGAEAKMARESLLLISRDLKEVPDYSKPRK